MAVDDATLDALAAEMLGVFRDHELVRRSEVAIHALSLDEAYLVQQRVIARRVIEGEEHVGWKVGCTSRAIQSQFGLTEPVNAHLTHPHIHADGAQLDARDFLDLAVEPELVLHIGARLEGHDLDDDQLRRAIDAVAPGIELHNYRFVHGRPTSQELIASNAIHAGQVVGASRPLADIDLALEGVGVWVNDELRGSAMQAEILGSGPLASLRWLVEHLTDRGRAVEAGQLVIPGSAVGLVRVGPGDEVVARFTTLGSCRVRLGPVRSQAASMLVC